MSDSDASEDQDLDYPDTPDSASSTELEKVEMRHGSNACMKLLGDLSRKLNQFCDEKPTMEQYNLSDVQGARSEAYLGHLQLIQKAIKAGKAKIIPYCELEDYYLIVATILPFLLIGPPDIERQDLRQRLMEDSSQFATAVPHTTRSCQDHEEPGLDYHFISQEQFDSDRHHGKFMEYGEFENNYYGTSLEAIREVVNSGKICLLKVHPLTVHFLPVSDIAPFTAFLAFLEPGFDETED